MSDLQTRCNAHTEAFVAYIPLICRELNIGEPQTPDEREALWQRLGKLESCRVHGPLVKLMRWFSFWECHDFYAGEHFYTKFLMSGGDDPRSCVNLVLEECTNKIGSVLEIETRSLSMLLILVRKFQSQPISGTPPKSSQQSLQTAACRTRKS